MTLPAWHIAMPLGGGAIHTIIDRQREQHDEEMHEADHRGRAGGHDLHRLREQAKAHQRIHHYALFAQHQRPGIGAHDIGRPEWQHRDQKRQPPPARGHPRRDDPGQRPGQQHRKHRDHQRGLQRDPDPAQERGIAEDTRVIAQVRARHQRAAVQMCEAHPDHRREGQHEEGRRPGQRRGDQRQPLPALLPLDAHLSAAACRSRGPASRCRWPHPAPDRAARAADRPPGRPTAGSPSAPR